MRNLAVAAAGYVTVTVGCVLWWPAPSLIAAGAVLILIAAFLDLDRFT